MAGNRRLMIGALLLLVVGTLGAFFARNMIKPAEPPPPKYSRVIAKEDIPPHVIITKEMIREEKDLPTSPGDVATTAAEFEKNNMVSLKKIQKGNTIPKDGYKSRAEGTSKAPFVVPEDKRAMAILVDTETGIGGFVAEGDKVDVITYYKLVDDTVARVVAQNLEVLATETTVNPPPPVPAAGSPEAAKAPAPAAPAQPKKLTRIVLAVSADQAQQLVAAKDKGGELIPILRNPRSSEVLAQLQETWEHPHKSHVHYGQKVPDTPRKGDPRPLAALGFPRPPAPPRGGLFPPPPEGVDVQVIRGSEVETKNVPR